MAEKEEDVQQSINQTQNPLSDTFRQAYSFFFRLLIYTELYPWRALLSYRNHITVVK